MPEFKEHLDEVHTLVLGSLARNQEMNLMIFTGPFQLERFCDNTNSLLIQTAAKVFGNAQIVVQAAVKLSQSVT